MHDQLYALIAPAEATIRSEAQMVASSQVTPGSARSSDGSSSTSIVVLSSTSPQMLLAVRVTSYRPGSLNSTEMSSVHKFIRVSVKHQSVVSLGRMLQQVLLHWLDRSSKVAVTGSQPLAGSRLRSNAASGNPTTSICLVVLSSPHSLVTVKVTV